MEAISAKNLTKSFGSHIVLDNLNLEIKENEIFGILGADGAGKSTLFRILATLLLQDSGECYILGQDSIKEFQKIRSILGYMPGTFSLYTDLSIIENLEFFASIFNVSLDENYDLIKDIYIALEPFKHRKAGALSGGMKQKLALCCALIHKPQILLLDEPTTGVDMISRREFWEILSKLKSEMTIIASTPYMDEATMCDRVALLHEGKFLSVGEPEAIIESFPHRIYACEFEGDSINLGEKLTLIRTLPCIHSCFLFGDNLHIVFKEGIDLENLACYVSKENTESSVISPAESKIDSSFSHLAHELDEAFYGAKLYEIKPNIEDCFMEFLHKNEG